MNAVAESLDVIPSPIIFTDSAAEKVAQLIEEEGNPDLKLRVFVQGGGCSGFQYGFTFDEIVNEDDTTMSLDSPRDFQVKNASINRFTWADGKLALTSWGEVDHLSLAAMDDIV